MSYFNKDKKRTNWDQSLRSRSQNNKPKKIARSLQYLLVLKKFDNVVDYKTLFENVFLFVSTQKSLNVFDSIEVFLEICI